MASRKRGAAGDDEPGARRASSAASAVAAQPGLAAKRPRTCIRCRIVESGDVKFRNFDADGNPLDNACDPCYTPFPIAYASEGITWEDMARDSMVPGPIKDEYELAMKICMKIVQQPWFVADVVNGQSYEPWIKEVFAGIRSKDFEQHYGMTTTEAAAKMKDAQDTGESPIKALLVKHPLRPFIEYELVRRMNVVQNVYHLQREEHLLQNSASVAYSALTDSLHKDKLVTALRNTTTTMSDVDDLVLKKGQPLPAIDYFGSRRMGGSNDAGQSHVPTPDPPAPGPARVKAPSASARSAAMPAPTGSMRRPAFASGMVQPPPSKAGKGRGSAAAAASTLRRTGSTANLLGDEGEAGRVATESSHGTARDTSPARSEGSARTVGTARGGASKTAWRAKNGLSPYVDPVEAYA